MVGPSWIAIDWGTSNVRAWAIGPSGAVLAQATSKDGVGKMAGRDYEDALMALIAPWLGDAPMDVVICGMAGARNGWIEAPYRAVPCGTPIGETIPVATRDQRVTARIIPGLKQASPADVMRGEDTQIAGFL
ncbi:MAG: 2-dehydro-3-deoxygalactonokinase, partial [Pseudomonadota bacterium]